MDFELLDQLRDELFKAFLQQDDENIVRLERAIYMVEDQIAIDKQKKEIAA